MDRTTASVHASSSTRPEFHGRSAQSACWALNIGPRPAAGGALKLTFSPPLTGGAAGSAAQKSGGGRGGATSPNSLVGGVVVPASLRASAEAPNISICASGSTAQTDAHPSPDVDLSIFGCGAGRFGAGLSQCIWAAGMPSHALGAFFVDLVRVTAHVLLVQKLQSSPWDPNRPP